MILPILIKIRTNSIALIDGANNGLKLRPILAGLVPHPSARARRKLMKKIFLACATAAALAVGSLAAPNSADAGCGTGCAWGIGVGSFVGGAVVGGAIARSAPPPGYAYGSYYPAPGYVAYNGYYGPVPVGCPGGYWARRQLYDQWGNFIGWSRPRFFCPY